MPSSSKRGTSIRFGTRIASATSVTRRRRPFGLAESEGSDTTQAYGTRWCCLSRLWICPAAKS
jgi:hypothetical protein